MEVPTPLPGAMWRRGPHALRLPTGCSSKAHICHRNATWGSGEAGFGSYSFGFSLLFLGWNFSLS